MRSDWPVRRLEDLCERITVGHVGPMADQYEASGVAFLRSQNIRPFRLDLDGVKYIGDDFHARLKKSELHPGDVAIIRTGYPGTACVIPDSLGRANCADLVIATPGPDLDPHFLAAIFNSSWGVSAVAGRLVGSAQQHFNVSAAKAMQVHLPGIGEQRRIVRVLRAYDDLIENNMRRIAILDEMAQTIYREWFVEFRYPGHEGVPLVDSDLGSIPEGWEVRRLLDEAEVVMGQSPKSEFYNDEGRGLPFHQGVTNFGLHFPTHKTFSTAGDRKAIDGDILFSVRAPVGRINVSTGPLVLGRGLCAIRPQNPDRSFMLCQLRSRFRELDTMGSGAIFNAVRRSDVEGISILWPCGDERASFAAHVDSIFSLIRNLTFANRSLQETRDLLLPRLISGEVDVSDLDLDLGDLVA